MIWAVSGTSWLVDGSSVPKGLFCLQILTAGGSNPGGGLLPLLPRWVATQHYLPGRPL